MPQTNQEFADNTGITHSMASRLRSGKRLPSAKLMGRISSAYGIPANELLAAHAKGAPAMGALLRKRAFAKK
jgi:transcriptional regulator with XRE-family HTH domain